MHTQLQHVSCCRQPTRGQAWCRVTAPRARPYGACCAYLGSLLHPQERPSVHEAAATELLGRTATAADMHCAQTPNASLAAARERPEDVEQVLMDIQNGSKLAISWMPTFRYQPRWSWNCRPTVGQVLEVKGSKLLVRFDASEHPSPPMAWYTTFIDALWPLLVPALPPGVSIDIKSNELKGWIDLATGEVDLNFSSDFGNMAFGKAATKEPLKVDSRMTTEALHGHIFQAIGRRIMDDASAVLVALSAVPVTSDDFQNWLLKLPTDALSVLNVKLTFVMKQPAAAAGAAAPSQPQAQASTM